MGKNNQTSEEMVVRKRISIMAFYVVFLTSLSFIGAFMLRKYKTAIVMLLIQIFVATSFYDAHHGSYSGGEGLAVGVVLLLFVIPLWLFMWLWGLILTAKAALTNNGLNAKDVDKNNQTSEEIVVSKRTSIMALLVVLLTSLSFIGAFMLRKYKTAIDMLLIQIVLVACAYYTPFRNQTDAGSIEFFISSIFSITLLPSWLCAWSWGLNLTAKATLAHSKLNVTTRKTIITAVSLMPLFIIINILAPL